MRFKSPPYLAPIIIVLIAANSFAAGPATREAAEVTQKQLETWWADLEKSDPDASRALLNFSSHPTETVVFLGRELQPLTIDSVVVDGLIAKLGSNKESEWKPAFDELEYFDPRLAIDLPTLMDQVKQSPARQRLVEIRSGFLAGTLSGKTIGFDKVGSAADGWYNFFTRLGKERGNSSWGAQGDISKISRKPKWDRAIRAIVLLEHIGTSDAVAIIQDMATGNPDAQPTVVAKEALKRISKQ